jgi:peptidoglycan/LPS O-acetylase OafA/YrhL
MRPSHTPRDLRPDIQALRAVAVSMVVAYHLWPHALPGGFVGVDVFFVISGFLITLHLIERPPTNASGLVAFWGRRIRRLLPASLLVLAASVVATWAFLPETQWQATAEQARSAALYYVNWTLLGNAVDYLSADRVPTIVQHYWSLSVEEQFYLIWPILVLALTLLARKRYALGLGAVVVASFAYSVQLTTSHPAAAYFSTWTRIWELGAGGLLAVAAPAIATRVTRGPSLILVGLGWVGIALSCFLITSATPFPGWAAALPVAGALLVIAGQTQFRPYSWLPVHWLGDVSYSIYLWHWPLMITLPVILARGAGAPGRGTLDNIAIVLATLIASGLTKRFVEDRFRTPDWSKRLRATYVLGAAGMAIVVALASGLHYIESRGMDSAQAELESALATKNPCLGAGSLDLNLGCPEAKGPIIPSPALAENGRGPAYDDQANGQDCSSRDGEHFQLVTCTFGDPKGKFDVALFGNSHAAQWLPALIEVANARHWKITTYIVSSCVPVKLRADWDRGTQAATDCLRWTDQAIAAVTAQRPDLLVFANRTSNPVKGVDSLHDSMDEWAAAYRTTLTRLAVMKRPIVVIQDTPASIWSGIDSPPECVASRKDPEKDCSGPRAKWVPDDPAVTAAESLDGKGIHVIDLNDYLCTLNTCSSVVGGVIAYADGSHMTETFNRTLAPYLDEALQEALDK